MSTLRIRLLFQFGYSAVQRVTDYGLHMYRSYRTIRVHLSQGTTDSNLAGIMTYLGGEGGRGQSGPEQCC